MASHVKIERERERESYTYITRCIDNTNLECVGVNCQAVELIVIEVVQGEAAEPTTLHC